MSARREVSAHHPHTLLAGVASALAIALMVAAPASAVSLPSTSAQTTAASTATTTARAQTAITPTDVPVTTDTTWSFTGNAPAQEVSVAVPDGLTPTRLHATATPDSTQGGTVQVTVAGALAQTLAIPAGQATAAIDVPLSAAAVVDGQARLSLRWLTDDADGSGSIDRCTLSQHTLAVSDIRVDTTGDARTPTTITEFLSNAVTAISIRVDDPTADDQRQAALAAAGALAHRYGGNATISVTGPDDTDRAVDVTGAGGRIVAIHAGAGDTTAEVGVADGIPQLSLTGQGDGLADAARALGSDLVGIGDAASTTGLTSQGETVDRSLSRTFADLGTDSITLTGLGQSQASLAVDQADFAQPVSALTITVSGANAALPAGVTAVLTFYWNDQVVDSVRLDDQTAIQRTIEIPAERLQSSNTLRVELDAGLGDGTGTSARCGSAWSALPIRVDIDGATSHVDAQAGQTLGAGFARFPQTLGGALPVAFADGTDGGDLTDAAAIVTALQQASRPQLDVTTTGLAELRKSSASGLVIGADADTVADLGAPLHMAAFRSIDSSDEHFGVGVDHAFAALQAFETDGRNLLVLSSWDPDGGVAGAALQHRIGRALTTESYTWAPLSGDLYIAQSEDQDPATFSSGAVAPQQSRVSGFSKYGWWAVAVVGVLVALLGLGALVRARARARARSIVDAEQAFDAEASDDAAEASDASQAQAGEEQADDAQVPAEPANPAADRDDGPGE